MKSRKRSALLIGGIFIGVVVGLILSSRLDWTPNIIAENNTKNVQLGSQETVSEGVEILSDMSAAFARVASNVQPSVVTVKSTRVVELQPPDIFRYFFDMPEQEERRRQGLGSGVVVSEEGYIVTNNHVIADADELTVTFGEEQEYGAEIVGRDPESDIAVIKIDAENLKPIPIGDSDELQVGEWVLAVGNPFSELLDQTVTAGIVSAKGRSGLTRGQIPYENFIQTDAAINPGNSGGALVNLKGELVGVNTMIFSRSGGSHGIGFAIPVNLVERVMTQLIEEGKVTRGWLGVMISNIDEEMAQAFGLDDTNGALISQVVNGSPAAKAGLQEGDIIRQINGKEIKSSDQLMNLIAQFEPGTKVDVVVWREEDTKTITVKLGERPEGGRVQQEDEEAEDIFNTLGLEVSNLTNETARRFDYQVDQGVIVTGVQPGSVAARENIRPGDLILSVNRKQVENVGDFNDIIKKVEPNDVILFRMRRGDTSFFAALRMPEKE